MVTACSNPPTSGHYTLLDKTATFPSPELALGNIEQQTRQLLKGHISIDEGRRENDSYPVQGKAPYFYRSRRAEVV